MNNKPANIFILNRFVNVRDWKKIENNSIIDKSNKYNSKWDNSKNSRKDSKVVLKTTK